MYGRVVVPSHIDAILPDENQGATRHMRNKSGKPIQFRLRTVFLAHVVCAVLLAWLAYSLRHADMELHTSAIVSFCDAASAQQGATMEFSFRVEGSDITAHVEGNLAGVGGLKGNQARYFVLLAGTAPMSVPTFDVVVPFTRDELVSQIEEEIAARIDSDEQPTVVQFYGL